MTNDIVARLRKEIAKRERPYPVELLPELSEAADEIKRLRNELTERIHMCDMRSEKIIELTDEIERLRTQLEMWQDGNIMAESHHDEIKRLTAERDEARREVSYLRPSVCLGAQTANEYARERGWDCFKEEADHNNDLFRKGQIK